MSRCGMRCECPECGLPYSCDGEPPHECGVVPDACYLLPGKRVLCQGLKVALNAGIVEFVNGHPVLCGMVHTYMKFCPFCGKMVDTHD